MAKTTINLPALSLIRFESLQAGECFMCDGSLYMRLPIITGITTNAVKLRGGERAFFGYNDEVQPVDVEINVSLPK